MPRSERWLGSTSSALWGDSGEVICLIADTNYVAAAPGFFRHVDTFGRGCLVVGLCCHGLAIQELHWQGPLRSVWCRARIGPEACVCAHMHQVPGSKPSHIFGDGAEAFGWSASPRSHKSLCNLRWILLAPFKNIVFYGVSGPSVAKTFILALSENPAFYMVLGSRGGPERKKRHVERVLTQVGKIRRHDGAT